MVARQPQSPGLRAHFAANNRLAVARVRDAQPYCERLVSRTPGTSTRLQINQGHHQGSTFQACLRGVFRRIS